MQNNEKESKKLQKLGQRQEYQNVKFNRGVEGKKKSRSEILVGGKERCKNWFWSGCMKHEESKSKKITLSH